MYYNSKLNDHYFVRYKVNWSSTSKKKKGTITYIIYDVTPSNYIKQNSILTIALLTFYQ